MSEGRASKLQRLNSFRRSVPYCSQSALAEILANVAEHGLPDLHGKKHMREAADTVLDGCNAYGPLFKTVEVRCLDGAMAKMTIINVFSWLAGIYKAGGAFARLLRSTMETSSKPLQAIFYTDEVTPGNVLNVNPSRKSWAVYMSFANFPEQVLSQEDAWITILIERTSFVNTLSGNMSQVFKMILQEIFENPQGNPQHGLLLQGHDQELFRLRFVPSILVQDGAAHKYLWSIKGDSGSKFCFLCRNCTSIALAGDHDDEDSNAVCKVANYADLSLATDTEIWDSMARLKARYDNCNKKTFDRWQQATGITFSLDSVLCHEPFRDIIHPVSMYMHDWMHCCLSNGCMSVVCWLMMKALSAGGLQIFQTLPGYLAKWEVPKAMQSINLPEMFSSKRIESCRSSDKLKCTASEMLTFHVVFAFYLTTCILTSA